MVAKTCTRNHVLNHSKTTQTLFNFNFDNPFKQSLLNVKEPISEGDLSDEYVLDVKPKQIENLSNNLTILPTCYERSKWKAIYLRDRRIYNNWQKRRFTAVCELRGHDEHVITCMQTVGDITVTGSDDHTLRVWQCSTAQVKILNFNFNIIF